jgi:hypothetical protein
MRCRAESVARVEPREDVDDVHAGDRVLPAHASDELRQGGLVGHVTDDAEQRRLLVRLLLVGRVQEVAHAKAVLLGGDDLQDGRFGDARCAQGLEQQVRREVAAAGEGPGDARDDARAALDQPTDELGEGLGADDGAQHVDEGDGRVLVGFRQRGEHGLQCGRSQILQLRNGLLRSRALGVLGGPDFRDEPVGAQGGEKAHSAFPSE